jgi:hypothetical protein
MLFYFLSSKKVTFLSLRVVRFSAEAPPDRRVLVNMLVVLLFSNVALHTSIKNTGVASEVLLPRSTVLEPSKGPPAVLVGDRRSSSVKMLPKSWPIK